MNKLWMGGFHRFKKVSDPNALPKEIIDVIDPYTLCVCVNFNRAGTLLGIGCNDGRLIIWDFITNTIARTFSGHTSTVVSLSWSQDDKYICTGSADRTVIVWDILAQKQLCRCTQFVSIITKVQFHPRSKNHILITSWFESPTVFNVENKEYCPLIISESLEETIQNKNYVNTTGLVASYSKRGKHILVGDSVGNIFVFDGNNLKFLVGFRWDVQEMKIFDVGETQMPNNNDLPTIPKKKKQRRSSNRPKSFIKELNFSTKKYECRECFVVISIDRFIRLYTMEQVETLIEENKHNQIAQPIHYQDLRRTNVNCLKPFQEYYSSENYSFWITVKFSNDGKFIFSIGDKLNSIFIWSVKAQEPRCILTMESQSDTITDIVWHPLYSIICSLTNGRCNVWGKRIEESWCSYEPNFTQTDKCDEYYEAEQEFDHFDEDYNKSIDPQSVNTHIKDKIDIVGCDGSPPPYLSSDENPNQENLCFLGYSSDRLDDSSSTDISSSN